MRSSVEQPRTIYEALARAKARIEAGPEEACAGIEWSSLPEPSPEPPPATAVDGGSIRLDSETTTLYAAKAWAGIFTPSLEAEEAIANAGPVVPPENAEDRISIYREILEAALAARHTPPGGLLLLDGSIRPVIRWWRPGFTRGGLTLASALEQAISEVEKWAAQGSPLASAIRECRSLGAPACLEELLRSSPLRPASAELAYELGPRAGQWIVLVEVMEKLLLYKEAIEAAWSRGATPVFITKTSRQRTLCGDSHPRPDVYYIKRRYPSDPGYTLVARRGRDGVRVVMRGAYDIAGLPEERRGTLYPSMLGLAEFYEERLALVEAYARLAPGAPILLVGVAIPSEAVEGGPEAAVARLVEVLSHLRALPGNGYPAPLFIAHHKARILREEARALEDLLLWERGRVMLEF